MKFLVKLYADSKWAYLNLYSCYPTVTVTVSYRIVITLIYAVQLGYYLICIRFIGHIKNNTALNSSLVHRYAVNRVHRYRESVFGSLTSEKPVRVPYRIKIIWRH